MVRINVHGVVLARLRQTTVGSFQTGGFARPALSFFRASGVPVRCSSGKARVARAPIDNKKEFLMGSTLTRGLVAAAGLTAMMAASAAEYPIGKQHIEGGMETGA